METDMTKSIKSLTHAYRPKLNPRMRTIRWADEVWTPTGIVDSIRFEDYNEYDEYLCRFIDAARYTKPEQQTISSMFETDRCFRARYISLSLNNRAAAPGAGP